MADQLKLKFRDISLLKRNTPVRGDLHVFERRMLLSDPRGQEILSINLEDIQTASWTAMPKTLFNLGLLMKAGKKHNLSGFKSDPKLKLTTFLETHTKKPTETGELAISGKIEGVLTNTGNILSMKEVGGSKTVMELPIEDMSGTGLQGKDVWVEFSEDPNIPEDLHDELVEVKFNAGSERDARRLYDSLRGTGVESMF